MHSPWSVPHLALEPGQPSSTVPSLSSSRPLPHCALGSAGPTAGGGPGSPSSIPFEVPIGPEQLLSMPSHTSAFGSLLHVTTPAEQIVTPPAQAPWTLAHAPPTSVGLSSTVPLQSSSLLLQTSG